MGKHGPCCHCGVTSTPLWRNGPPEKPVLCNACGSRWRTKGSLTNYTPMHAREPIDSEELKVTKAKSISLKSKEQKLHKKKQSITTLGSEREIPYSDQNFRKIADGDTSNRSSSGSAISYSESCAHFGTTDASDMTGSAQSNVWDPLVPSKKRTGITRPKSSSVEKLTKDLYTILHEQQSSYQGSSEGDLLYESRTPMGSFEIGYGSVLIRHPKSKSVEEESEASSLPEDNKSYIINEAYSGIASFHVHSENKGILSDSGNDKKSTAQVLQENGRRDKFSHDKLQILRDRESPLCSTDLQDVKCKQMTEGKGMATRPKFPGFSDLASLKRMRDGQNQNYPELKETMRSPKRMCKSGSTNLLSGNQPQLNSCDAGSKLTDDADDFIDNEEACFSPRSFFASPPDRVSMVDDSTDHDLLLDVPCNASFPEAELLYHPWKQKIASSSSPSEGGVAQGEESRSNFPSSFSNKLPKNR
ncbi:GATA transcription factor 26 isoform X2 [Elaeis guineensis]|uniref:GATA transcription factor 26 isoform X2 n=1 Tax=Elaeis guineensis var. tenera TaxID=51953 RepID=A0A6I9RWI4_ELAGV|nr:GATA transcription factor 26 isoform X2 [Elaeis guineensis]